MDFFMKSELPARTKKLLDKGIEILRRGGVIAFPTDTVFGVGAGIYNEKAIERVFEVKLRTRNMSLPVLLSDVAQVHEVAADIQSYGWRLIDAFWPGGLTLIVYRSRVIKDIITNGSDTVAIRMPDHIIPRELIKGSGMPLIGTSANISGQPAVTTAEEVRLQFKDSLDLIIDGLPAPRGTESTIIDITGEMPILMREGFVSKSAIEKVVGRLY
jgi:L-threonylcarbamoyladenylate synthase